MAKTGTESVARSTSQSGNAQRASARFPRTSNGSFSALPSAIFGAAIAIALLVIGMLVLEENVANVGPGLYLTDGKLTDTQKASIDEMLELVKLLMNWAIAVIGASAFFLKLSVEKDVQIRKFDILLVFLIVLLSVASLFLGHLVIDQSSQILSLDQFPVNNERLRSLARYQYLIGLGAIALFGFHVFQFFWSRQRAVKGEPK